MLSVLKGFLSSDQGLVDDREALFTFIVPSIDGLGVVLPEGQWGFFAPSFVPWKILALVSENGTVVALYWSVNIRRYI